MGIEHIQIVAYQDWHADAFAKLNREWLDRFGLYEKADDGDEGFGLNVVPQTQVFGADAAARLDGRRFNDDQPRAANRAAAEVNEMPVCGYAILPEN